MIPPPPDAPPVFTDDPLQVGVTVVKALHITELRDAVNLVRARAGLAAASWAESVTPGVPIKAAHILELRTQLDQARTALGLPAASYSPPAPSIGASIRAAHVKEIRDYVKAMLGTTSSSDSAVARLDPANQTGGGGENPLSRNYNWGIPLVGLPGRGGLDLGLSLSYNSLVWTKRGSSSISFDDDGGFPSPGFRLGFPVIQPLYYNAEVGKYAFMLITPDGGHTELRQVNTSALYEAADSSHLLLDTAATMVLRTTDGTQLTFAWKGSDYQCTEIKDRNGNYLTINYDTSGRIDTVVDTLNRTINFNYDSNRLSTITQVWEGQSEPHVWASFAYENRTLQSNFPGLSVTPANNSPIQVLRQVTLDDGSRYEFEHTAWGQVWKISNFAAGGQILNFRAYNLPGDLPPHSDCPRFTERHDWAQNWNRSGPNGSSGLPAGAEQEVLTGVWTVPAAASWTMPDGSNQSGTLAQVTAADGTYNKIYFEGAAGTSTGWKRGLPSLVETYDSGNVRERQSVTAWTQDDTGLSYLLNPRVTETNVYDPAGNRARTTITYQTVTVGDGTSCKLPQDVTEFQANATTPLRRTHTDYNSTSPYTSRRIIGLVSEQTLYQVDPNTLAETLMSKVGFNYDGSIQGNDEPVHHDNANYSQAFTIGRANLSSVKRFDVNNTSLFTTSTITYNTAGATVASTDPLGHTTSVSYADNFSDGNNTRNTLAYPTTVTDADGFSSTAKYNFDLGAVTRTQSPPPAGQTVGAIKNFTYDSLARLQKVAIEFGGNADYSHTRFEYPISQNRVDSYSTIQEGLAEGHSFKIVDGHGRTIASASDHSPSTGGFSGQLILYDAMGRTIKQSNPTETSDNGTPPSQWVAAGDDDPANGGLGWLYTQQTYDWKGRPLVTTNTDGTTKEASYGGCGCAGGQVVTLTDEGTVDGGAPKRRQQKIYADVLGRTVKTEMLNWQGGSVYTATVNTYNARDQVTLVRQYAGVEGSETYQDTAMTYDGYGRLKTKHVPQQDAGVATTYNYNSDDTVSSVVDGRGANCAYGYNNRHQVTSVAHTLSGYSPINISYAYDAAGNRTLMSHSVNNVAQDSATYVYDQLSRLTSETRHLNALEGFSTQGNYSIGYSYTLGGELQSVTDPFNSTTNYSYDTAGRTSSVTGTYGGTNYNYATGVQYRAWGAVKAASFGDGSSETVPQFNSRLQPTQFRLMYGQSSSQRDDYSYYDDGRLKQFTDLDDTMAVVGQFHYMSRVYNYDQSARVKTVGPIPGTNVPPPFSASYGYDVFDNMTSRSGQYGLHPFASDSSTYTNNRRNGWTYDADGRLTTSADATTSSSRTWSYDAAGEKTSVAETVGSTTTTNTMAYDGDGQLVFESVASPSSTTSDYLIHSTGLGGAVLNRLDSSGANSITYVPANGLVAPMQQTYNGNPYVSWVHRDALGVQENSQAYDPLGNLIANEQPPTGGGSPTGPIYGPSYGGAGWGSFSNANNLTVGCTMDGAPASCDSVLRSINGGTATAVIFYNGSAASIPSLLGFMPMTTSHTTRSTSTTYHDSSGNAYPAYGVVYTTTISSTFVSIFGYDPGEPPQNRPRFDDSLGPPPPPVAVQRGIDQARNALQQNSLCRALFFGTNPLSLLNTYASNGLITSATSYPVAQPGGGIGSARFSSADIGAATSIAAGSLPPASPGGLRISANPITVNQNGFYYTGRDSGGVAVNTLIDRGFYGLSLADMRGAVILHELLHAAGRIPGDLSNPRQSQANSELVRRFCFPPNAPLARPSTSMTTTLR
jgi:YD repeat-containing protein